MQSLFTGIFCFSAVICMVFYISDLGCGHTHGSHYKIYPGSTQFTTLCLCDLTPILTLVCVFSFFSSPSHPSTLSSPSGEEEVASGLTVWRKALSEVRSAAQLAMCIKQLQKSIAWGRSIKKAVSSRSKKKHNTNISNLIN